MPVALLHGLRRCPTVPPAGDPLAASRALEPLVDLGPGLDPRLFGQAPERLCAETDVRVVVVFGSRARGQARADSDLDLAVIVHQPRLTPAEKAACWHRFRKRIGPLGVGVDLVVAGSADAERLSGSRWHVFGNVAREGKVLHVAG
jgi:predicted nucleotidyltransferase